MLAGSEKFDSEEIVTGLHRIEEIVTGLHKPKESSPPAVFDRGQVVSGFKSAASLE